MYPIYEEPNVKRCQKNSWDVSHLMDEQENIRRTSLFWPVQRQAMVIVAYVSHLSYYGLSKAVFHDAPCTLHLPTKLGDFGGNY